MVSIGILTSYIQVLSISVVQAPMYYRRANAALIVFDITREKSFDEAKEWVKGT